jgi:hypothetical protein
VTILTTGYSVGQIAGPVLVTPVLHHSYQPALLAGAAIAAVAAVAGFAAQHGRDGLPRDAEGSAQVHPGDHVKVRIGVVGERLGHEHSSVVDQRVHLADLFDRLHGAGADALRRAGDNCDLLL